HRGALRRGRRPGTRRRRLPRARGRRLEGPHDRRQRRHRRRHPRDHGSRRPPALKAEARSPSPRRYLCAFLPLGFLATTCFLEAACAAFAGDDSSPSSLAAAAGALGAVVVGTGGAGAGVGAAGGGVSVVGMVGGVIAVAFFDTSFAVSFLTAKMPSSAAMITATTMMPMRRLPPISPITSSSLMRSPGTWPTVGSDVAVPPERSENFRRSSAVTDPSST